MYIYICIYECLCECRQIWAVSPIQYIKILSILRQKMSIVDTFVFVFVSIIKIKKVFVIVSISHK